ncbi:MAG: DUF1700 domain-containing protein [Clostridiales Family XIII bacterium]|jgi:uncharacterized membrane protein|nr:DUF1700 domain-containing protein [Clostridiales Family XIII bacterium]
MNRKEFMAELERQLARIDDREREEALAYYNEYFDEAGPENEARVIAELGSPVRVAAQIKADAAVKGMGDAEAPSVKKGMSTIWFVILGILALPIALPIVFAVFALGIGLLLAAFLIVVSLAAAFVAVIAAGVFSFIAGVGVLFASVPTGLFYMGGGLAAAGVALLLCILMLAAARGLAGGVARLLNAIRVRGRERHERKAGVGENE